MCELRLQILSCVTCSQRNVMAMEDQEKLLTEALNQVKKNAFEMKTCLVSFFSFVAFCCIRDVCCLH